MQVPPCGSAADLKIGIIAPDGREAMLQHAAQMHAAGIPFIFDPGQGLPMFDGAELKHFRGHGQLGGRERLRRPHAV
jgi:hypothetical protein